MGRLVELQDVPELPGYLTVRVGDILRFAASGAKIRSRVGVVETLGPFMTAVLADNGEILSPMGPPSTLFLLARRPGREIVEVLTGDPWHAQRAVTVEIVVEPGSARPPATSSS